MRLCHIYLLLLILTSSVFKNTNCKQAKDSLRISPTKLPSDISSVHTSTNKVQIKSDVQKHAYTTKIHKRRLFHHHYIYKHKHHSITDDDEHDHEIKIPTMRRIKALYRIIDINNDNIIDRYELKSVLHLHKIYVGKNEAENGSGIHHKLIVDCHKKLDVDGNGLITKEEYMQYMEKSLKSLSKQLLNREIPISKLAYLEKKLDVQF